MSLGSEHLGPDSKQARDAGLRHFKHTPDVSDCAFNKLVIWPGRISVADTGALDLGAEQPGERWRQPPSLTPGGVPVDLFLSFFSCTDCS